MQICACGWLCKS